MANNSNSINTGSSFSSGSVGNVSSSTSGGSSNSSNNNELKQRLSGFKTEVAGSLNVNLKQGYNGDLTAREAGSIGGEMVKRMIAYAEQNFAGPGGTGGNLLQ
ncbi:MAG: Small, acid-soluble spore protein C2 [Firmicutes bacterium ADurb.Bin182]|nr:MAG: Small, acid-soluble spore protein C2 [Firmicutes bacterium ADurb.Bin182]